MNFKNSILLIVFNYSECVINKDILKTLYERHFKQIIFYSDLPEILDKEVNFIKINRGYNTHVIFNHFYNNYKDLIDLSDGIFYTMDDNIINTNILNLYDNDKIIYPYNHLVDYMTKTEEWWHTNYGRRAIEMLMQDEKFKNFEILNFSGGDGYVGFSDFFFLPKKYLTKKLFETFEIFAKYQVFLEIAVPTIINNLEKDPNEYQSFTFYNAWPNRNYFLIKENIYEMANKQQMLFLHPIKFNQNPIAKEWLKDIFCREKCVIITTINKPSDAVLKHVKYQEYDVIIVGDIKTPSDGFEKCIFLDIKSQQKLFPKLSKIPFNHYCRKNFGYLYAIKKGYKIIYETDDDNIPYDNFDKYEMPTHLISEKGHWINIFQYFTNSYIWPRGFPLSLVKTKPSFSISEINRIPSIITGLVENDPDVDAIFRLTFKPENIAWEKNKNILVSNKNMCVFNSQNTFWINPIIFISMLIPSVSFRYCDILRGIITNIILSKTDNFLMYISPNVIQNRNEHNLMSDFVSEYEMYIHNENIFDILQNIKSADCKTMMKEIYNILFAHCIIQQIDLDILDEWLKYF